MQQPQFKQGPVSASDLMAKLAKAKKVMNKVDNGDYATGNIDTRMLNENVDEAVPYNPQIAFETKPNLRPVSQPIDVDRIQNSKLPDAIKQAMINNPIDQGPMISLNETLDMDIIKGAKKLIEQDDMYPKKHAPAQRQPQPQRQNNGYQNVPASSNIDMNAIAILIENTVRKVMDEKLNQILSAQQTQSINESLVLKVGDSIFKGKITGVNKSK